MGVLQVQSGDICEVGATGHLQPHHSSSSACSEILSVIFYLLTSLKLFFCFTTQATAWLLWQCPGFSLVEMKMLDMKCLGLGRRSVRSFRDKMTEDSNYQHTQFSLYTDIITHSLYGFKKAMTNPKPVVTFLLLVISRRKANQPREIVKSYPPVVFC